MRCGCRNTSRIDDSCDAHYTVASDCLHALRPRSAPSESSPAICRWRFVGRSSQSKTRTAECYGTASRSEQDKDSSSKLIIFKSTSSKLNPDPARYRSRFRTDPQSPFHECVRSPTVREGNNL